MTDKKNHPPAVETSPPTAETIKATAPGDTLFSAEKQELTQPNLRAPSATENENLDALKTIPAFDGKTLAPNDATIATVNTAHLRIPGYEILEVIGRGGMGVVYRARDVKLDRFVAIKTISTIMNSPETLRRFENEAKLLGQVSHPFIAQIHDVGIVDEGPYLAMELVPGKSLDLVADGKPLKPRRAAQLTQKIALALAACHEKGIIHRDVKPSNAIVDENDQLKLTDFGLAKLVEGKISNMTKTGEILGTPAYMAPEQARGTLREIGPGTDVHGVGAVLYELLTGRPPFAAPEPMQCVKQVLTMTPPNPRSLQPDIPRDLETITMKCLAKQLAHRYLSCQNLAEDLNRYLKGEPILAKPTPLGRKARLWAARHPAWAAMIGLSIFGIVASFAGISLHNSRLQQELTRTNSLVQSGRELSIWLLSDFSEILESDEGLTFVRSNLAERTQQYLDSLRLQAGNDEKLKLTLAESFVRLAELQGRTDAGSLGQPKLARLNLNAAQEVIESLSTDNQESSNTILTRIALGRAELDFADGNPPDAGQQLDVARKLFDSLKETDTEIHQSLQIKLLSRELEQATIAGDEETAKRSTDELQKLGSQLCNQLEDPNRFALIQTSVLRAQSCWLNSQGRSDELIVPLQQCVQRISELSQGKPTSLTTRMLISNLRTLLGEAYYRQQEFDKSAEQFDSVRKSCEQLLQRDSLNHGAVFNLAHAWHWIGDVEILRENLTEAENALANARNYFQQYADQLGQSVDTYPEAQSLQGSFALLYFKRGKLNDARKHFLQQIAGLSAPSKHNVQFRQQLGEAQLMLGITESAAYVELMDFEGDENQTNPVSVPTQITEAFDRAVRQLKVAVEHFESMKRDQVLTPQSEGQLGRAKEMLEILKTQHQKILESFEEPDANEQL